jgi:synaptobrevin family protein YKT6
MSDYVVHCYARSEGVAGVIITKDYPHIAAHSVLSKLMDQFLSEVPLATIKAANKDGDVSYPALEEYLNNFQDANQASSIAKIQQELDETKIVLHKAIDSVRPVCPMSYSLGGVLTLGRCYNVARNSTTSWPRAPT